jgi:hypothetical protein
MSDTDETLVRKAQQGDRSAFEDLIRRTSRLVYARLCLETGDAHRAEDLLLPEQAGRAARIPRLALDHRR